MKRRLSGFLVVLTCLAPLPVAAEVDFRRDVEPILKSRCHACHGVAMQMNGLRLDRRADALAGSHAGPVIVPGDAAKSRIIERVTSAKEGFRMPPAGPALSAGEIEVLRSWIAGGAAWPETAAPAAQAPADLHWSYHPVQRPEPPAVKQVDGVRNPIDAFVLARLERRGSQPRRKPTAGRSPGVSPST
jgi:hypothetical protein